MRHAVPPPPNVGGAILVLLLAPAVRLPILLDLASVLAEIGFDDAAPHSWDIRH